MSDAKVIRARRLELGLTQSELAERIYGKRALKEMVSRAEVVQERLMTQALLRRYAKALGLTEQEFDSRARDDPDWSKRDRKRKRTTGRPSLKRSRA